MKAEDDRSGVLEQGNMGNMQGGVPWGPGLGNTDLECTFQCEWACFCLYLPPGSGSHVWTGCVTDRLCVCLFPIIYGTTGWNGWIRNDNHLYMSPSLPYSILLPDGNLLLFICSSTFSESFIYCMLREQSGATRMNSTCKAWEVLIESM